MKLGIIRERKTPPDARTPLIPSQCAHVQKVYDLDLTVEPSPGRCYQDEEYRRAGIRLKEDLSDCEILLGVKEVPIEHLLSDKTYCFFSHTIKKQPHNRDLLRAVLEKGIRLIDYEVMSGKDGYRLIAFGRFAGMVGAHNAVYAFGERTGAFQLPRMHSFYDYHAAKEYYRQLELPPLKIVLTGTGRVGTGAADVLRDMDIRQVAPQDFINQSFDYPVFTQLRVQHYVRPRTENGFHAHDYYQHPEAFVSRFGPFTRAADIMINGIYWDKRAPAFFSAEEMRDPAFRIRVIADITCDIAPEASIPSTLRPSSIEDPVYGYDPFDEKETAPHQRHTIDIMAIDNLPSELPRDASRAFGEMFIKHVLPEFFREESPMLQRATIAENGRLTERFAYLRDYAGV